jgi:hypothetical protein
MKDSDVVDAFVAHLAATSHPGLRVERRPDDDNRRSSDIDAIAGPFAIEHTSVDTLPNQRRDSDWFMHAAGGVENELEHKPPLRLNITLEYDAVGKGQNWPAIRAALKAWVTKESPHLADGRSVVENLPGIPFRLHVMKASDRRPGVFFARYQPEDDSFPERVKAAFNRKAANALGIETVLLVENDDIALMNEYKMFEAIRAAFPAGLPGGVDQIWYVGTSVPSTLEFRDFTSAIRKSVV